MNLLSITFKIYSINTHHINSEVDKIIFSIIFPSPTSRATGKLWSWQSSKLVTKKRAPETCGETILKKILLFRRSVYTLFQKVHNGGF